MTDKTVDGIRAFNRFYTTVIGVTNHHVLQSRYSLTEVRILFEIDHQPGITARQIMATIQVDEGYLSRVIARLVKQKLVQKKQLRGDKRVYALQLSETGKRTFKTLNQRSADDVARLVAHLDETEKQQLLDHLNQVSILLTKKSTA